MDIPLGEDEGGHDSPHHKRLHTSVLVAVLYNTFGQFEKQVLLEEKYLNPSWVDTPDQRLLVLSRALCRTSSV